MDKLIYLLEAIRIYAKDCHYAFSGVNFKSLHEWMDEIADPLYDWIDEIKESVLLKHGLEVPRGTAINALAAEYVPTALPHDDNEVLLRNLRALISMTLDHLDTLAKGTSIDVTIGEGDIYGRLGAHLQKHVGLMNLALGA